MDYTYLIASSEPKVPNLEDTTKLIEDNGIETVLSAVIVIALVTGILFAAWWGRRKVSGKYIEKDKALDYVRETNPCCVKPTIKELHDLRNHDVFDMWDRELRHTDSIELDSKIKTDVAKDIIKWYLRAHRNGFKKILTEAYQLFDTEPSSFEKYFGDTKSFQHKVNQYYTDIKVAFTYKMRELGMPKEIVDKFDVFREDHNETMRDMIQLAISNYSNNYWRMHEVLNSQYLHARTFRSSVIHFVDLHQDLVFKSNYVSNSNTVVNMKIDLSKETGEHSIASKIFD